MPLYSISVLLIDEQMQDIVISVYICACVGLINYHNSHTELILTVSENYYISHDSIKTFIENIQ